MLDIRDAVMENLVPNFKKLIDVHGRLKLYYYEAIKCALGTLRKDRLNPMRGLQEHFINIEMPLNLTQKFW